MILPASYANGFAPRDGEPLYPELWRGCVGAWNPGLGPSGLTLRDWSAYKNHGTLTNMAGDTDWVPSQGRYALDFDGSNDFVETPILTLSGVATFSLWFYANSVANYRLLSSRDGANNGFDIYALATGVVGFFNGTSYDSSTGAYTSGKWNHLVAQIKNTSGIQTFLNNLSVFNSSGTVNIVQTINSTYFGKFRPSNVQHLNGQLDDIRIYNRVLSQNEIRLLVQRRGIAYELAPRRRTASEAAPPGTFRRRQQYQQLVGGGVI